MSTWTEPSWTDVPRPPRVTPLRVLAWALIALAIIWLVFAGGGFAGIYGVRLRIISLAILAVMLVVWLVWAWRHAEWRPSTTIWPAFVVSLAVMAFATAISPTPRFGIEYVAWAVLLTGSYLLLVRLWADPFFRPRLGALTVSAAFALCLLYIAVVVSRWVDWWGIVGSIVVPPLRPGFEGLSYGNPSAVLTVAVLLVTAAVAHLGFATVGRRITVAILLVLVGVVIVMTGSRAGWFAVPVAIVVTAVAWLLVPDHRASIRRHMTGRAVWVGAGVLAVVAVVAFAVLLPVILVRLGSGGEEGRLTFMATAFRMFLAAPITGFGPGAWAPRRIAFTEPGEIDYYVPHAHNVYLATAAEYGVLGLAAGLVAVGCVVWLIARAVRDADPVRRRFGWASLFGLVYFGAHQLLDFYPNMPAALFAFVLPIAFLDATAGRSITTGLVQIGPRLVRAAQIGLFVAVLASIATLAWSESIALPASAAVDSADHDDWAAALPPARDAVVADPGMPAYRFTLGLAAAATGDLATARDELEASVAADDLPEAWLDLAAVRQKQGDEVGARDALTKASRLGYWQAANSVAAAWLYLQFGDRTSATDSLVLAIDHAPSLAGDPLLASDPGFAMILPAAVARSLANAEPAVAWEIALVSGDTEKARTLAAALPDDARALAELAIAGWTGDKAALVALDARLHDRPHDMGTLNWTARVATRLGDTAAADRYQRWGDAVDGHSGTEAAEVRVVWERVAGDPIAGSNTAFHSPYVYRRPAPADHLVPWLPRLTYR